jgi:hypothetical protein
MGKSQEKKGKKENQSASHSESNTDTMAEGSILSEVNGVLYDNPAVASTPIPTQNQQKQ